MPDFHSRVPNHALVRQGMEQNANQQMMQEAFSMAPDADAVSKAIMDRKLWNSDMRQPLQEVNGIVGDYMTKFNKDPFYAFSREGRKSAQMLKQLVSHPAIKEWENNTVAAEDEYKRATANRVNKNIVVQGNDVLAIKDGKRQYISLNDVKSLNPDKGDQLLTVDNDMNYLRNKEGISVHGVPTYDLSKKDDIDKKIIDAVSGLGSTETEGLNQGTGEGIDTKVRTKTNEAQLKMAVRTLMTSGLTESDKNTLRSEYLKSNGAAASTQGFNQWLGDMVSGIASKKLDTAFSSVQQKGLKLDVASTMAGMDKVNPKLTAASLVLAGRTGSRPVDTQVGNTGESLQGYKLPIQETLNNSSGTIKDDLGNIYANRTPMALKVFSDATDLANIQVMNRTSEGQGSWEKVPGLARNGVVVDRPGSEPVVVYPYTYQGQNGPEQIPVQIAQEILKRQNSGAPLPPNLQKYVTVEPLETAEAKVMSSPLPEKEKQQRILQFRSQTSPDGLVRYLEKTPWVDFSTILPRKRGFFSSKIPGETQEVGAQVDKLGYTSQESTEMQDYHKKHSGIGDVTTSPGSPFSTDDEFYEVKARVPLTSFEQFNSAYGGQSIGNREDIHINSSELLKNYEVLSPNLFNSSSLPNMTSPAFKIPKFSEMK